MMGVYRLLFLPALLVALPYYALRMARRGGYARDFSHRLGLIRVPEKRTGVRRIWIQAVSVGEVGAVEPLLRELARHADVEVVLTTTTSTGYKVAREKLAGLTVATGIFPMDFLPFSRTAWRRIRPDLVALTEGELWPEHLHAARTFGVPSVLVNARVSDRSHRRYLKLRPVARRVFGMLSLALAGSPADLARIRELGVPEEKSFCSGNLKCDVNVGGPVSEAERDESFLELFGERPDRGSRPLVLLASSTWPGEEEIALEACKALGNLGREVRLVVAPRHAERRSRVLAVLADSGEKHYLRSANARAPFPASVAIADTTGELRTLTRSADLALVGKSFAPNEGGQTPVECALLGVPQVFGPNMGNFREISRSLVACGAALQVKDAGAAVAALVELAQAPERRASMSRAALAWAELNRGATGRTAEALLKAARRKELS